MKKFKGKTCKIVFVNNAGFQTENYELCEMILKLKLKSGNKIIYISSDFHDETDERCCCVSDLILNYD